MIQRLFVHHNSNTFIMHLSNNLFAFNHPPLQTQFQQA